MSKDTALIKEHPLPNCFSPELLMVTAGRIWPKSPAAR
jgi:hypothetical protein